MRNVRRAVGDGDGPAFSTSPAVLDGVASRDEDGVDGPRDVEDDAPGMRRISLKFHDNVEYGFRLALRPRLAQLRGAAAPPRLGARLDVGERHQSDAADEVRELFVAHEPRQVTVRARDDAHAAHLARPRRLDLAWPADLVDDNDRGSMVLHALDHDRRLQRQRGHLHSPSQAEAGVRHVGRAAELARRVDDEDVLPAGELAGGVPDHRRLAAAGLADEKDALVRRVQEVGDDGRDAGDVPSEAQRRADDIVLAVADGRDAV
mmetsp:Transcript_28776/g.96988  ORF Transcript_28776/g.96988 Transcript_28776/m.96988 type:complete len:262 (+) Transcript_28776:58-843(+)